MKRSSHDLQSSPKRRKVHHELRTKQPLPHQCSILNNESAQSQLLRAISIALNDVGFAAAEPVALEAFRSATERYITNFLTEVQRSMKAARRAQAIPQDFTRALSLYSCSSSGLLPNPKQSLPPWLTQPALPPPLPNEPALPSFTAIFGPELAPGNENTTSPWIPKTLPPLPSKHTYRSTPVYMSREKDPRRIRERATQEGILAEQALRKLMSAKKAGVEAGVAREELTKERLARQLGKRERLFEETLEALSRDSDDANGNSGTMDSRFDEAGDEKRKSHENGRDLGGVVNYERNYWMKRVEIQKSQWR